MKDRLINHSLGYQRRADKIHHPQLKALIVRTKKWSRHTGQRCVMLCHDDPRWLGTHGEVPAPREKEV